MHEADLSRGPLIRFVLRLQQTTLSSLLDILNATRSSDIATIVKQLSLDEQDTLMKYIYKGLSVPELGASPVLLGWHEKVRFLIQIALVAQMSCADC